MDITKGEMPNGKCIKFKDRYGRLCRIAVEWHELRFAINADHFMPDYAGLSQEDVRTILPYLQTFAETGTLEVE